MSRIGRAPIPVPPGVEVELSGGEVRISGPRGKVSWELHPSVEVRREEDRLVVSPVGEDRLARAMHGTARQLVHNMVVGVSEGFRRNLEIVGVGYNAKVQGKELVLQIGFCHPVQLPIPEGVNVECPQPTRIHLEGIDKQVVGQFAADIRRVRPPEPYKGKGIRYEGEVVRRKAAKSFGAT